MATIRLGRYEAREGQLPRTCMRCGAAASMYRRKLFAWHRWWTYLLVLLTLPTIIIPVFVLFRNERVLVLAPLCELHKNHWYWRSWVVIGGMILCVGFAVFNGIVVNEKVPEVRFPVGFQLAVLFLTLTVLILWAGTAIVLRYTAIRETKITKYSITLTGVADEFVEMHCVKCYEERQAAEESVKQATPAEETVTRAEP
jgi:hypothetical protein